MGFDVSTLANYTAPSTELLTKAVGTSRFTKYINWYTGIKANSSQNVDIDTSTVIIGGDTCGSRDLECG
jgi:hypothetical protein